MPPRPLPASRSGRLATVLLVVSLEAVGAAEISHRVWPLTLSAAIELALENNRDLQIEKINAEIARLTLEAAFGYYDPVFTAETHRDKTSDRGGFDPADLSKYAVYSAEAQTANLGLIGYLPTGLSYELQGTYANSYGARNALSFDSHTVFSGISVRQPLLRNFWIDQGRLTIRVQKKSLRMAERLFAFRVMDIVNQVQQAYYDLVFAQKNCQVQGQLLEARKQTAEGMRKKVETGSGTVLEETLAQAQVARAEVDLISARNTLALSGNVLRQLFGSQATNSLDATLEPVDELVPVSPCVNLQESWQRGLDNRPDLAQMRLDVERWEATVRYSHNQLFPALDFLASYGRRGASTDQVIPPSQASASPSDAFNDIVQGAALNHSLGVVLTIPLSRTAERANYRASQQFKKQADLRLKQVEEAILRQVADAVVTAKSNWDRVSATRRATQLAKAALAAEETKLAGGKSSLFFVFQMQSELASTRSLEIRALVDYSKALAQLAFAEGDTLERHHIQLEFR